MEPLKTRDELKPGKCTIVAEHGDHIKHFDGVYTEEKILFFTIPNYFNITGYIQTDNMGGNVK